MKTRTNYDTSRDTLIRGLCQELAAIERQLIEHDYISTPDKPHPARRLRDALGAMLAFGRAREICRELESRLNEAVAEIEPETARSTNWRRNTSSGFGSSCDSIDTLAPQPRITLPDPARVVAVGKLVEEACRALRGINAAWSGHWQDVVRRDFTDGETYKTMKANRLIPYGGREAFSVLRVWGKGELDRNYSDQGHNVFGMQFTIASNRHSGGKYTRNITAIVRKLRIAERRNIRESKGPAPSLSRGRQLIKQHRPAAQPWPTRADRREPIIHARIVRAGRSPVDLLGHSYASAWRNSVSLFNLCMDPEAQRIHRRGCRWLQRRISDNFGSITPQVLITGRPEQANETDYAVPCCWLGELSAGSHPIVRGVLLVRAGSREVYHLRDDYRATYLEEAAQPWPDAVRSTLNAREEAARRSWRYSASASAEERKAAIRRETARLVWTLRKLAAANVELTPNDSYAVANCRPGTRQFMIDLGIDENRITARDILSRWRASGYIQRELFGRVVTRLASSQVAKPLEEQEVTT